MSDTQKRFFEELLPKFPRLAKFWSQEDRSFLGSDAKRAEGVLSASEYVALNALASIWMGSTGGAFVMDFSDVAVLPEDLRKPLAEWILNPFLP